VASWLCIFCLSAAVRVLNGLKTPSLTSYGSSDSSMFAKPWSIAVARALSFFSMIGLK